jgi:DNA repair protein RecO
MEYITQGIILQSKKIRNEDKLYNIFSYDRGLVVAVAKSVSSVKSKLSGFLMPGNVCIFMLARGGDIDKVAQVKTLKSYLVDFSDNVDYKFFSQVSEILLGFLKQDSNELDLYNDTIVFLEDFISHRELIDKLKLQIVYFFSILKHFGFMPNNFFGIEKIGSELSVFAENDYLKNIELMLKLNIEQHDLILIKKWLKHYFESILERRLNSFA